MRPLRIRPLVRLAALCAAVVCVTSPVATARTPSHDSPEGREVWFAPLSVDTPGKAPWQDGFGATDFDDLFDPAAPWGRAAARVDVFKFYTSWVLAASDEQLARAMGDLTRRGIAIAIEAPALGSGTCGVAVEGMHPDPVGLAVAVEARIRAAGGRLAAISAQEPLSFGSVYDGPNACDWTPEQVAEHVAGYTGALRELLPGVRIGVVEADWTPIESVRTFVEAYQRLAPEGLAHLHWDANWGSVAWTGRARAAEHVAREHGIPFGMIYSGTATARSNEGWTDEAARHMAMYEGFASGLPDHVIFQSWLRYPATLLPDDAGAGTITSLIAGYHRDRTALNVVVEDADDSGQRYVRAYLRTAARARPLPDREVEVALMPAGDGAVAPHVLRGTVPDGATHAIAGYRVNLECSCSGEAVLTVYGASLHIDEGEDVLRAASFDASGTGWHFWGVRTLVPSDIGDGHMAKVRAPPGASSAVNSDPVPVSGGAAFELTFIARVAPRSLGSGAFVIIFIDGRGEIGRQSLAFPDVAVRVRGTTDGRGVARIPIDAGMGEGEAIAWFRGDDELAPAAGRALREEIRAGEAQDPAASPQRSRTASKTPWLWEYSTMLPSGSVAAHT